MNGEKAIIAGAGPAGLSFAYELLRKTGVMPIIYEKENMVGGLSRTFAFKGNMLDIGPHRFFSKYDKITQWWLDIMPIERNSSPGGSFPARNRPAAGAFPESGRKSAMMMLDRSSSIYFLGKFIDYPISVSRKTVRALGVSRSLDIICSYILARILPPKKDGTLESFFINRFGKKLYLMFFKDYTSKIWGVPCGEIDSQWGFQRVRGLSLARSVIDAMKNRLFRGGERHSGKTETSLIRRFMYPGLGSGSFWEETARMVTEKGGRIHLNHAVTGLKEKNGRITQAEVKDLSTGETFTVNGDYFVSSMPVAELLAGFDGPPPEVEGVAKGLRYRSMVLAGVLIDRKSIGSAARGKNGRLVRDSWIYIQDSSLKLCRIQVYNNWSPHMLKNSEDVWLGLEYLCDEGDSLWKTDDRDMLELASDELKKVGFIKKDGVVEGKVFRIKKAYPCYFGSYSQFYKIRGFTDSFENLFLIGRNGMHRYNNQDHAVMTAIAAAENIAGGIKDKKNIWSVNAEQEYHESK
ncbi:MAG: NAD(P)/FAD-dependent oxidoreductase [Elusimicrobia bacterium]|nr:NAD(P)/FAD-dependent oxidoreductase [Elusimicrobiota bacterium]